MQIYEREFFGEKYFFSVIGGGGKVLSNSVSRPIIMMQHVMIQPVKVDSPLITKPHSTGLNKMYSIRQGYKPDSQPVAINYAARSSSRRFLSTLITVNLIK